jgi:hypothetical protein
MRLGAAFLLAGGGACPAAESAADYARVIKPVLKERCYACHGALKQKAGLRVDTVASILRGGRDGSIVDLANPEASKLLVRLEHPDAEERMPPESKPLAPEVIAAIRAWIAMGAPGLEGEEGEEDPRDHWAFQRIDRPAVPEVGEDNPIDAFLSVKRSEQKLAVQPAAGRPLALRRLYLDLIGLPPTLEQLADERPWEEIVDELLESPHHGERWGRHWMDVWRYSDWYGLGAQLRYSQKHIWHWRDWIVESLNADKGYDRMIHEMLAGDELAPEDLDTVRATGFLARNYYLYYYRLRALFEPHQVRLDPVPGEGDFEKGGIPRVFDNHLEAPTWLHLRGDPQSPDKETTIEPGVPVLFEKFAGEIREVDLPYVAWNPGARSYVQEAHLAEANGQGGCRRGEASQGGAAGRSGLPDR